jgi:hypothetical protein
MKNKMDRTFYIDEKFETFQDPVMRYLNEVEGRVIDFSSGLSFMKLKDFKNDQTGSMKKLQDGKNESWGIFEEEVVRIQQELGRLVRQFHGFYLSKTDSGYTPCELNYIVHKTLIRIKRLMCIIEPVFSMTNFHEKKSDNDYTMLKIYWIDEEGNRKRNLTRNFKNIESELFEVTEKMIKSYFKNMVVFQPEKLGKITPDLVISDGKDQWVVETKMKNKEGFVKTFVMLDLWKLYKETYKKELLV